MKKEKHYKTLVDISHHFNVTEVERGGKPLHEAYQDLRSQIAGKLEKLKREALLQVDLDYEVALGMEMPDLDDLARVIKLMKRSKRFSVIGENGYIRLNQSHGIDGVLMRYLDHVLITPNGNLNYPAIEVLEKHKLIEGVSVGESDGFGPLSAIIRLTEGKLLLA